MRVFSVSFHPFLLSPYTSFNTCVVCLHLVDCFFCVLMTRLSQTNLPVFHHMTTRALRSHGAVIGTWSTCFSVFKMFWIVFTVSETRARRNHWSWLLFLLFFVVSNPFSFRLLAQSFIMREIDASWLLNPLNLSVLLESGWTTCLSCFVTLLLDGTSA